MILKETLVDFTNTQFSSVSPGLLNHPTLTRVIGTSELSQVETANGTVSVIGESIS